MKKSKKDTIREDGIQKEALVDAYESEEQALSWYFYRANSGSFPPTETQVWIVEKLYKLWSRHGRAEKVALHIIAAVFLQEGELSLSRYTFGHDPEAKPVRHGDDGKGNR
ncbi:MAG: hypothetical protein DMG21_01950 [Acidobacteria bacterium]|nr:MAG: hypothetical protein DMG21_01950 [Acidobacteriota bacterium]